MTRETGTRFLFAAERKSKFTLNQTVWYLKFTAPFRPKERLRGTVTKVHWPLFGGNTYNVHYEYHDRGTLKSRTAYEVQEDNIEFR